MPVQMQTFLKGGPMPLSLDALIESPTSLGSFYAIPRHRVPLDSDHLCTSSLASSQGQQNFFAIPTPVTTRLDGEGPLSYAAFDGYGDTYTILSHEPEPVELFSIPPPSSSNVTPFPAMMTFPDDGFADCSVLPKDTDVFLEPCLSDYQCSWAGQELATLKAFPIPFHDSTFCRQEAQPIVCLPTSDEIDGTYGAEEADCWDYSQASSSEVPSPMYEQFGRVACPPETAPGVVLESTLVQSQESPSKALVLTADEYSTFKATECLPLGETAAAKKLPPKSSSRRRKGPILCPVCNKQFCRPCNLKDHMYELEGQHECPTCGRRFQQKYNLSNHEKIHAGPFACTECLQKFKTRAILRSHLRSHNPDPVMKQCPEKDCNKQYKRGGCLNRHIKTNHREGGEYMCEYCRKAFRRSDGKHRHEKENCIVRRLLDASTAASSLPTGQTAASGSMSLSLGAENDTRLEFPQQSYLSMPDHKVHHSTMTMQQPQPRSRLQPHFSLMDNGLMVSEP